MPSVNSFFEIGKQKKNHSTERNTLDFFFSVWLLFTVKQHIQGAARYNTTSIPSYFIQWDFLLIRSWFEVKYECDQEKQRFTMIWSREFLLERRLPIERWGEYLSQCNIYPNLTTWRAFIQQFRVWFFATFVSYNILLLFFSICFYYGTLLRLDWGGNETSKLFHYVAIFSIRIWVQFLFFQVKNDHQDENISHWFDIFIHSWMTLCSLSFSPIMWQCGKFF